MSKVVDLIFLKSFWSRIKTTFIQTPKVLGKSGLVLTVSDDGLKWDSPKSFTLIPSDWNSTENPTQILNKPDLKAVATSGDYNDLINTPAIPDITPLVTREELEANYLPLTGGELSGLVTSSSDIVAETLAIHNGTSNQFLKADGSVDDTIYTDQKTFQSFVDSVPKEDNKLIYSDAGVLNAKLLLYTEGLVVDNDEDLTTCKAGVKTDMQEVLSEWQPISFSGYDKTYGKGLDVPSGTAVGYGNWHTKKDGDNTILYNELNSLDTNGFISRNSIYNYVDVSAVAVKVTNDGGGNDLCGIWPAIVDDTKEKCLYILELYANNITKPYDSNTKVGYPRTIGLSVNKVPYGTLWSVQKNLINGNSVGIGSMTWCTKYDLYLKADVTGANPTIHSYPEVDDKGVPQTVTYFETWDLEPTEDYSTDGNSAILSNIIGDAFVLINRETGKKIVPYNAELNLFTTSSAIVVKTSKRLSYQDNGVHSIYKFEFSDPFGKDKTAEDVYNDGAGLNGNYIELDTGNRSGEGGYIKLHYTGTDPVLEVDKTISTEKFGTKLPKWLGKFSQDVKRGYWSMSTPNVEISNLEYNDHLIILADHQDTIYEYIDGWQDLQKIPESRFTGSRLAYNDITKKLFYSDGATITNLSELITEVDENNNELKTQILTINSALTTTNQTVSGLEASVENLTEGKLPNQIYQQCNGVMPGSTVTISNSSRYLTISASDGFALECSQPDMTDPTSTTTVLILNISEKAITVALPTNVKNLYGEINAQIPLGKFAEITFTFWNDSWITMNVFIES